MGSTLISGLNLANPVLVDAAINPVKDIVLISYFLVLPLLIVLSIGLAISKKHVILGRLLLTALPLSFVAMMLLINSDLLN